MSNASRDPQSVPVTLVTDDETLAALSDAIGSAVRVAADTETEFRVEMNDDGVPGAARVLSFATRAADGTEAAWVVDLRDQCPAKLAPVLATAQLDGWNATFDERVFETIGLTAGLWYDGMLVEAAMHAGVAGFNWWGSLAGASKRYCGIEDLAGKGTTQLSYNLVDDLTDDQISYAAVDAVATLWVCSELAAIAERDGLTSTVMREVRARPFVAKMIRYGIPFDMDDWLGHVDVAHRIPRDMIAAEIAEMTGGGQPTLFGDVSVDWNIGSATQAGKKLNEYAPDAVRAALGGRLFQPKVDSVDDAALKKIDHPLAKALLGWRAHEKVITTYGENLREHWSEGRLRSNYKQALTDTGRLASDKPNAQNFDKGMKKRARPELGRIIAYGDLSQAELRAVADEAGETAMIESFRSGEDLHMATASRMSGIDVAAEAARAQHYEAFKSRICDELSSKNGSLSAEQSDSSGNAVWDSKSFWEASDLRAFGAKLRAWGATFTDEELAAAWEHRDAAADAANRRQAAKAINFGIIYGLGAARLADQLSAQGIPTSKDEAKGLLDAYLAAYPRIAEWLRRRDDKVEAFASNPPAVNWAATFNLYRLHLACNPALKDVKDRRDPEEIARAAWSEMYVFQFLQERLGRAPSDEEVAADWDRRIGLVAWWLDYRAPVVLGADGSTPISFESRTKCGRRRLFQVPFVKVLQECCNAVVATRDPARRQAVIEFTKAYRPAKGGKVSLFRSTEGGWKPRRREELAKVWEDRQLCWDLLQHVLDRFPEGRDALLTRGGLAEAVRGMKNQYRNHPIQAGVADAMEDAFAVLNGRLDADYENAFPIQSVHDSVSFELDIADGERFVLELQQALESSLEAIYPAVPAVADCDLRTSLDDGDVVAKIVDGRVSWLVDPATLGLGAAPEAA